MEMEKTLVLLKPDAVARGLIGKIISRIEEKGLQITAMKMLELDDEMLKKHYSKYVSKPFFPALCTFMKSGPSIAIAVEGKEAIKVVRQMLGATNGRDALPGTIRGDFGMSIQVNLAHASDDKANAEEELKRFFTAKDYVKPMEKLKNFQLAKDEQ